MVKLESFNDLQSFEKTKYGHLGSIVEFVCRKNMIISHAPLNFAQTKYILLWILGKG